MRVGIVGAGPAGLYLAILLKRDDPTLEVTVVERNPSDATYGWGVVFSEETLGELRDADYETFLAVDDQLVRWSAIDIHHGTAVTRSYGHGFSAIRRTSLLRALQERARALGVALRFEEEAAGPELFAGCDVIVGADGVNSTVRASRPEAFGTEIHEHETRYVWFGTDLVFDVFTFVFRDTEHGLFTVHAYPFDADASTFIVECGEATWRNAGLDTMSEEDSIAYCQELFADLLGPHRLMSNRSVWTTFATIRNRAWHDGEVVLVGDAAHTAHFSIGSGTKLAMEDSIALRKALVAHGEDLDAAYAEYELERQLPVERFQEAAVDSSRYFATVARYLGFAPEQFTYNLLTRSGRITHLSLAQRDPAVVSTAERWLASAATDDPRESARIVTRVPLDNPLTLRGVAVPNRVVITCLPTDAADDGRPGAAHAGQIAAAVDTGAGLVVTDTISVSADGRVTPGCAGLYRDEHVEAWAAVLERARGHEESRIAARLGHAGRRGATRPRRGGLDRPLPADSWPLLAPSPEPYTPRSRMPEDLFERTDEVRDAFAAATRRAAEAGFDLLVLDMSDGYLLASCLSPLSNRRDDAHGGSLERRMRYPLEVLAAVRDVWPADRPLGVRINADDRMPGGLTPDEAITLARAVRGAGADLVDVVAGHTVPWGSAAPDYRRQFLVELSTKIRNETPVPTVTSGNITTLDDVNTIVAAGRADLVVLDPARYRREVVKRQARSDPGGRHE